MHKVGEVHINLNKIMETKGCVIYNAVMAMVSELLRENYER